MPRSNAFLLRLGIVASLSLAVLLGIGGGLRSSSAQRAIAARMSKIFGAPVQFSDCSPGLFRATRFLNLTATDARGNSLSAKQVEVSVDFLSLCRGRLDISKVHIEGARVVHTDLPSGEAAGDASKQATSPKPNITQALDAAANPVFRKLNRIAVSDAAFDWIQSNGQSRIQLEGLSLKFETVPEGKGSGTMSVKRGVLLEAVPFEKLSADVLLEAGVLKLDNLAADCGLGSLLADAKIECFGANLFEVRLGAKDVDLADISREIPATQMSGIFGGRLEIRGSAPDQGTWEGKGEMLVSNGSLKGLSVLQMMGQVFQVPEIAGFKVREAKARLKIADRQVLFEDLKIDGGDIVLTAPGKVSFSRSLDLSANLMLPDRLMQGKVMQLLGGSFSAPDEAGRRSVAFHIAGTIDKPSTDLIEKLVGGNLGGVIGGVVEQVFGGLLKNLKQAKPQPKDQDAERK